MTEEICNTSCYQIPTAMIITPETKKHLTSIVFIFKRQTLSSPTQNQHTKPTTISYECVSPIVIDIQSKSARRDSRNKFMCLNTYLLTYTHIPTTTRCLSIYQRSRLSRKLVIKVTETPFLNTSRKQLFHKPRFMLKC